MTTLSRALRCSGRKACINDFQASDTYPRGFLPIQLSLQLLAIAVFAELRACRANVLVACLCRANPCSSAFSRDSYRFHPILVLGAADAERKNRNGSSNSVARSAQTWISVRISEKLLEVRFCDVYPRIFFSASLCFRWRESLRARTCYSLCAE